MRYSSRAFRFLLLVLCSAQVDAACFAQEPKSELQIPSLTIGGTRSTLTESWGTLQFTLHNPTSIDRDARVVVLYEGVPDVQYARDVWIPANSMITTWLPVGPAPQQSSRTGRDTQFLLYDRTGGRNELILPREEEKVRSRSFPYRPRETTTAVLIDLPPPTLGVPDGPPRKEDPLGDTLLLTRALPQGIVSDRVTVVPTGYLPPSAEAFDGTDTFILAGNRLVQNPAGLAALRHWLQQGGKLWVMLDIVDPAGLAPLLGEDADFTVVDRVPLTRVEFLRETGGASVGPARDFDRPVDLVRVVPGVSDRVLHTVNGWPVTFTRRVGRGKVLFTTLGPRAWYRPRTSRDIRASTRSDLPEPMPALEEVGAELMTKSTRATEGVDLRPILTEDIGYTVIGRNTAAWLLGAFVLILLALGVVLRRSRRPEVVGWAAPAAAILILGIFVLLGERSRRSVPPTIAAVAEVDAVRGSGEASVTGLYAMYQPSSGPAVIASHAGASLNLDSEGLAGQKQLRIQTDTDAWHWDDLSLPAGVRSGSFRATLKAPQIAAVSKFGPEGIEGHLSGKAFRNFEDAIVVTSTREPLGLRLKPEGTFAAGPESVLASGQYIASTVLSDRQQRRQEVYRQLLGDKLAEHLAGRNLFVAWADLDGLPFESEPGTRVVGSSLLVVPLELERTAPDTAVSVPRAFVPYRRVLDRGLGQATMESSAAIDMRLRFQLPASVLPLTVEKATFLARLRCPSRTFSVDGYAGEEVVPLVSVESPGEPVRLEITDRRVLQVDSQGALFLRVRIGAGEGNWTIEMMGLDVVGKTTADK
jgi:hypothetical protein